MFASAIAKFSEGKTEGGDVFVVGDAVMVEVSWVNVGWFGFFTGNKTIAEILEALGGAVYRKNVFQHNLGVYHYYFKEFEEAIKVIKKQKLANYPNPYFRFDDQTILLRSLYESEKTESLENACRNFKAVLENDDFLPVKQFEEYDHFISAMRKLLLANLNQVEERRFNQALKELNALLERPIKVPHWFKQKMGEF